MGLPHHEFRFFYPYLDSFEHQDSDTARFEAVCFDCPGWDECSDCTIERGAIMPTCEASLEHSVASEPGLTLETLAIDEGYWRATTTSKTILECYNTDACAGGVTGSATFCAPGYTGPCEERCENAPCLPLSFIDGYDPPLYHTTYLQALA